MQSGRDDLMDKVKEEVISEGPETEGGCFTGLAVECPALTVSPWIGCGEPVLDGLPFYLSLKMFFTGDFLLALRLSFRILILNSTFARIVINSCYL